MNQNRRDFIKSSTAMTILTVSNASTQAASRTVGIVHTTEISDQEMACFQAGLGSNNWQKQGEAKGQYGGSHGHDALKGYIKTNVDVVVAAGGVTSQMAAWEALGDPQNPPFVYMSGMPANPPSASDGKYCGVILNIPALYFYALNRFNGMGINNTDVWLIQNYNADMTRGELAGWAYKSFRFFESSVPIDNPDPDPGNSAKAKAAFAKEWTRFLRLYPRPRGLIINPDPYFRLKSDDFKSALRTALGNIPVVCYPFTDYNPASPDFCCHMP
jgi:hypothetical protein